MPGPTTTRIAAQPTTRERMVDFLTARLDEELAALWDRELRRGPDLARLTAHAAILEEHLSTLRRGALPTWSQLAVLLIGYREHPDFDPAWPATFARPSRGGGKG